ncbi:MAG: DUF255 domain-containing protein [Deltaproteobacteria bacterium]|nr:DUF255 domain-containing protein [Deltaproteobacteria bacterium]
MMLESFSDPEMAGLLDRDFISIRVDREKLPDLRLCLPGTCLQTAHHPY